MTQIHETSRLTFYTLKFTQKPDENGEYTILRWDTDENMLCIPSVKNFVIALMKGQTVKEAREQSFISEKIAKRTIALMLELSFINAIDGEPIPDHGTKIKPWLTWIKGDQFGWFLNPFSFVLWSLFVGSGVILGVFAVHYQFSYINFFWTSNIFTLIIVNIVVGIIATLLHEVGHFIATKAVGGESRIDISYRFLFLVFQTTSYHLSLVPRAKRYFVYFSGIMVDLFLIAGAFWVMTFLSVSQRQGVFFAFLSSFVMIVFLDIVWQFNAYLETDIYNFIADILSEPNLYSTMKRFLRRRVELLEIPGFSYIKTCIAKLMVSNRIKVTGDDLRTLSKEQRIKIILFTFLYILGISTCLIIYCVWIFPRDWHYLHFSFVNLESAWMEKRIDTITASFLAIFLIGSQYLFLVYFVVRQMLLDISQ